MKRAHTPSIVRARADRSLATVLFVDIVDSTRIASEVGDRRWRELLGAFRRAVRRRLRLEHGQEQDTAGDGFFSTFDRPASAIRAAVGVVEDVQALGLDARCGIHTGELERIDGRPGGIAAHIGARVMALAGPAEVLVTGTVHDLVVGGGIGFDLASETELKGVPGRWSLYRVAHLDRVAVPAPLSLEVALDRLGVVATEERRDVRRPRPLVVGLAAAGALALAALGAVVLTLPRDNPSLAGDPSPAASATAPANRPPTVLKIDPQTNEIVREVYDGHLSVWSFPDLFIVDGSLWHRNSFEMVRRDLDTGDAIDVIREPGETVWTWIAFGSLWFEVLDPGGLDIELIRADPLSGRETGRIRLGNSVTGSWVGRDSLWYLTRDAILEIDPSSASLIDEDPHGLPTVPDGIAEVGSNLWICECDEGRIVEWDPRQDAPVRSVEFAQRGFILDDRRNLSQSAVTTDEGTVWLLDSEAGTITPVDAASGEAGQPLGIPRDAWNHVFGLDSVWLATGDGIFRLPLDGGRPVTIQLEADVIPAAIAIDEATESVWVANWVPEGEPIPAPMPAEDR